MGAFDGGLARLFGAALAPMFGPATLHRVTRTRLRGGSVVESIADVACRARLDAVDDRLDADTGGAARMVRIRVLADGLGVIAADDRITLDGARYAIVGVARDPAGAAFDLRARRG